MPNTVILNKLKENIAKYPDFPKKGILFEDLNPLYKNPDLFSELMQLTLEKIKPFGKIDYIVGIEARGFILGSAIAHELDCGFIPMRKKGKLPGNTKNIEYALEYGKDNLEIQYDDSLKNSKILILDDVFATGGTIKAAIALLQEFTKSISTAILLDIKIADITKLGVPTVVVLA